MVHTTMNSAGVPPGMIQIPDVIPIFPLAGTVLMPGEVLPLHIFEPRYRAMVRDALNGHRIIGMVEYEDSRGDAPSKSAPAIRNLGCAGFIAEHKELPDGRFLLWLLGLERFSITEELAVDTLYRQARVSFSPLRQDAGTLAGLQPIRHELRQILPRLVELLGILPNGAGSIKAVLEIQGLARRTTMPPWPQADELAVWMVAMRGPEDDRGVWHQEKRNVREDFRRLFGKDVESIEGVAIMTDTDQTGESALAWYADIEARRR